jgi:hypothetical protein
MAVFQTPFGTNTLVGAGGNVVEVVHNQFGPRDTGGTVGVLKVEGMEEELVIDFTGEFFNEDFIGNREYILPAGTVIKNVYMDVEEVFVTGGTFTALDIGTVGSEATNGFSVTSGQLEAAASVNLTSALSGTWDSEAPLAANTPIGFVLTGSGASLTNAGKARITIQFYRINRAPSPAAPGGVVLP